MDRQHRVGPMKVPPSRQGGVYDTVDNPFTLQPFLDWADRADMRNRVVLEPFAGRNNIIGMLDALGLCGGSRSYDIEPRAPRVARRDTIRRFPGGHEVCVTNPPWLARHSAGNLGLRYPETRHDNVYKKCLELALLNCDWVAFIIPGSFLRAGLFRERLSDLIFIERRLFADTDAPACLALFEPGHVATRVYVNDEYIGSLRGLERIRNRLCRGGRRMRLDFNQPDGPLGLHGVDNTREPSIRFCRGDQMRRAGPADRYVTRIGGDFADLDGTVDALNHALESFRRETHDIFLLPFKGLRLDGRYRRRLDYGTAAGLIRVANR